MPERIHADPEARVLSRWDWSSWLRGCLVALLAMACGGRPAAAQVPARTATLEFPNGVAFLPDGSLLISERRTHRLRRLDMRDGMLHPVAGTGEAGYSGDGGPAVLAALACPDAIDTDRHGNIYIADRCNARIRRIDAATGIITTVAGTGGTGPAPDGPALSTALTGVFYLRVASDSLVLFTDTDANLVRELDLASGMIRTLAGNGEAGFGGDGGPARGASLTRPHVVARLVDGSLLIGDSFNHRLRLVDPGTGIIRTIAGNGEEGPAQDGAQALASPLLYFGEVLELSEGTLTWSEWGSSQVVQLDRGTGTLRVLAGSTAFGAAGPDGPARGAALGSIVDMVADDKGQLVVAAASAGLVRRIDLGAGTVETLAGRPGPER